MTPGIIDRDITVHDSSCCLEHCCLLNGCNCSDPLNNIVFVCCIESTVGAPYGGNECNMPGGCQSEGFTCQHICCNRRIDSCSHPIY